MDRDLSSGGSNIKKITYKVFCEQIIQSRFKVKYGEYKFREKITTIFEL